MIDFVPVVWLIRQKVIPRKEPFLAKVSSLTATMGREKREILLSLYMCCTNTNELWRSG